MTTNERLSAVVNELNVIQRSIPANRSDPDTMRLKFWIEQASIRAKRAQNLLLDIALTPHSGRPIEWDSL